jgi:uncharacterized protein YeaO (DUF488 family)
MKYKLYTTYLGKLRSHKDLIPDNCKVALIMRFPPFLPKDGSMIHVKELSPKGKLLSKFKDGEITFEEFKTELWNQWESNEEKAMDTLKNIEEALDGHNHVCLICCEEDYNECHRKLLGEYFEFAGYKWEEL